MQPAVPVFGDQRYERLATISVAYLYNLRRAAGYEVRRCHWTKTKGYRVPIPERRAPPPDHHPGFIRIDSVRQGDLDGVKGLYHINAAGAGPGMICHKSGVASPGGATPRAY